MFYCSINMISGKSFADKCRWVVDPRYPTKSNFHYYDVVDDDWVFVNGDYLSRFRSLLQAFPFKRFHVIVHNTDRSFGQAELELILPWSKRIYAINTTIHHPRLTTIPIGFVDRQLSFLQALPPPNTDRTIDVYMNFTLVTNTQKRKECKDALVNNPRVVCREGLSVEDYYADLRKSKYVLCPEGTGIDTHRVYESILCGAIPVVLRNSLAHMYEGMPVCILNKWTDPLYEPAQKVFHTNVDFYL
jgi:hypothetical protein